MKTAIAVLLALLGLALYAAADRLAAEPAECSTDLECLELCAPDSVDCDGGPQ